MLFFICLISLVASIIFGTIAILLLAEFLASKDWTKIFRGDDRDGI